MNHLKKRISIAQATLLVALWTSGCGCDPTTTTATTSGSGSGSTPAVADPAAASNSPPPTSTATGGFQPEAFAVSVVWGPVRQGSTNIIEDPALIENGVFDPACPAMLYNGIKCGAYIQLMVTSVDECGAYRKTDGGSTLLHCGYTNCIGQLKTWTKPFTYPPDYGVFEVPMCPH